MRLEIDRQYHPGFFEDCCKLSITMLRMKSTHLFIASNSWDSVRIELEDSIPEGCLHFIGALCEDVKVDLPTQVTDITILRLAELFPKLSGKLRRTYLMKGNIKEVLRGCLVSTDTQT